VQNLFVNLTDACATIHEHNESAISIAISKKHAPLCNWASTYNEHIKQFFN